MSGSRIISPFTPAERTKLAGVTTGATLYPGTGEQAFLDADHTKLNGIYPFADVTGSNPPQSHGASVHTDRTRYVYLTSPHVLSSVTPNLYGSSFSADGDEYLAFNIRMPNDFSSFTSVKMIYAMNSANAGDVVISGRSRYGGIGESKSIHSDNDNDNIITPGNDSNIHEYTFAGLFTSVTADDYVNIFISRTGTSGDDTHTQAMILLGVIVTYTADM